MVIFFLDFGSNDISIKDLETVSYIFITHEHGDHFSGLLNEEYASIIIKNKIQVYSTYVTKDLMSAVFENESEKQYLSGQGIKNIRKVLEDVIPLYYDKEYQLSKNTYIKAFQAGHTYGSSMFYINLKGFGLLYTGDMDFEIGDTDRQYSLCFETDEKVDVLIADGTNIANEEKDDKQFSEIKNMIANRGYNNFLSKIEKIPFTAKKLQKIKYVKEECCIIYPKDMIWYLKVLLKHGYYPFIQDQVVLPLELYKLPAGKKFLNLVSKKGDKKFTNLGSFVKLHIYGYDFIMFVNSLNNEKLKVFIGHYNEDTKLSNIPAEMICDSLTYLTEEKVEL